MARQANKEAVISKKTDLFVIIIIITYVTNIITDGILQI